MIKEEQQPYPEDFSTDDVYLGQLAAQVAKHERAEYERAQRLLDEQQKLVDLAMRMPGGEARHG